MADISNPLLLNHFYLNPDWLVAMKNLSDSVGRWWPDTVISGCLILVVIAATRSYFGVSASPGILKENIAGVSWGRRKRMMAVCVWYIGLRYHVSATLWTMKRRWLTEDIQRLGILTIIFATRPWTLPDLLQGKVPVGLFNTIFITGKYQMYQVKITAHPCRKRCFALNLMKPEIK